MNAFDPSVLVTAFLAGLLGSGHCFGMCGGIAGSLGALSGGTDKRSLALPALQFNLGRMLGYALLGAIAAGVIGAAGEIMALKAYAKYLRLATAILVLLIGLRFLVDWGGINFIEKGGASLVPTSRVLRGSGCCCALTSPIISIIKIENPINAIPDSFI